jgi:hypothetical protein
VADNTLIGLLNKMFGVHTSVRISAVPNQIGVATVSIARQNPNRIGMVISNLSANTVYIAPDNSVSPTHGIRLGPSGGTITLLWFEDFELCGYEWFGQASGAGSDLYVQEILTEPGPKGG